MVPPARVSVVVPVYNGERHVAETLRSLAAQTLQPLEVIVVDDGSTDGTLQAVAASGVDVKVLRKANGGVSSARNAGLAAARGDLVAFVDQDDHWYPEHLARQVAALAAHPEAGVVVSPYLHWYPDDAGVPTPQQVLPAEPPKPYDPDFSGWVYHQFMLDCWALTSATLIRREVLERHGAFDIQLPFSEDWELWLRLSRHVPFVKLNWPPVLYRQHPEQGSRTVRARDWRCELLLGHARRHGLASRDGRALPQPRFDRVLSGYQLEFGWHHLAQGSLRVGARSVSSAVRRFPRHAWRAAKVTLSALVYRAAPARSRQHPGRRGRNGRAEPAAAPSSPAAP